ncbi:MAG TPA: alpha/beta hydrolase [Mucilaginibacter sp.]
MKKISLSLAVLMASSLFTFAQNNQPIPLYPDGVPNSKPAPAAYAEKPDPARASMLILVTNPTITPFFPDKDKANGAAVIICPGGGYRALAITSEGFDVAKEFNKIGVAAFVLKYRLPSDDIMQDKTIGPLQDAQTAIAMVRSHAAEWGINPNKVGIMGFSAGGHLASTAGTHFDKVAIANKGTSVRPDFMVLMYPVISFGEQAHKGSRDNLIGKTPTAQQVDLYSNEKQVTANTPPTFIVQAEDDTTVPIQNSLLFYDALVKAKVKAELHVFQAGGHGFGLNNPKSPEHWFEWCSNWMTLNGLLNGK